MDSLRKLFVFSIAIAILNISIGVYMVNDGYRMFYGILVLSSMSIIYVTTIVLMINAITSRYVQKIMREAYIMPIYYISIFLYIFFYMVIGMWYLVF